MQSQITIEELKKLSKEEVLNEIRKILSFEQGILDSLKDHKNTTSLSRDNQHYRFEMSGYETIPGQVTIYNQNILNKFAFLGIYDFTDFLVLDFYKGSVRLFYQYFYSGNLIEEELDNYRTVDIIYRVFEITLFSDQGKRRRI